MTTDIEWVPGSFTLNDEQKAEIVKAVEEFFDIFPKLRRPVYVQGQIPSRISVQGSYAVTDMRASHDHLMEVSAKMWNEAHMWRDIHNPNTRQGSIVGVATTPAEFRNLAIKHEMGHLLMAVLRENLGWPGQATDEPHVSLEIEAAEMVSPKEMGWSADENPIVDLMELIGKKAPRFIVDSLDFKSGYAISGNPDEWIAEAILDGVVNGAAASESGKKSFHLALEAFGPKGDIKKVKNIKSWSRFDLGRWGD
jgi:hypothetical protein